MNLEPSYASLGQSFYEYSNPAVFKQPSLLLWNDALASELSLDGLNVDERVNLFSGQSSRAQPLYSLAYAGHQFGHFNPQLGDGRAHLLAEAEDSQNTAWELQLKGSGPTPFSRGGDGFCALGPALREYIMSEAIHALSIPTCRTLAVVTTGEHVLREQLRPGAVLTRAAHSHIRIGTFQFFAARGELDNLKLLADYTINRHYPEITETDAKTRYSLLLKHFIDRQVELVCHWMRVGFIHGVMNTDNVTLSAQTIDYGPCAMLEKYRPNTAFSSIDKHGRYAFSSQPDITFWNVVRFAECLLPIVDADQEYAAEILGEQVTQFETRFEHAYEKMIHAKFGFAESDERTSAFIQRSLSLLESNDLDYTQSFTQIRHLFSGNTHSVQPELAKHFLESKNIWENFDGELMSKNNPVIIPRNHLVEAAIKTCVEDKSLELTNKLIEALKTPYSDNHIGSIFDCPAEDGDEHYQTFCGT